MAGRPPHSSRIDGEASPNERQGLQSGSNPGQHPSGYVSPAMSANTQPTVSAPASSAPAFPVRPGEPNCHFYLRTGQCKFGASCRFNHPGFVSPAMSANTQPTVFTPASSAPVFPLRPGEPDCQFYLCTGHCAFGSSCRFNHPVGIPRGSSLGSEFMLQRRQQTYVGSSTQGASSSSHGKTNLHFEPNQPQQPYSVPVYTTHLPSLVVGSQRSYPQAVPPTPNFRTPRLPPPCFEPKSGRLYPVPNCLLRPQVQPGNQRAMPFIPGFRNIRVPLYDEPEENVPPVSQPGNQQAHEVNVPPVSQPGNQQAHKMRVDEVERNAKRAKHQ